MTTLINNRPFDNLSNVAAILAATPGDVIPGRMATRNFMRLVTDMSEEAATQASSQKRPVGNNAPV